MENKRKQKTVIVVKSKERGARTKVTACGYSPDGKLIGGGTSLTQMTKITSKSRVLACLDGALHIWQTSSNFVRPNMTIEGAHAKSTETGSLVFSVDGRTILTRGGDDTVKCTSLTMSCFTSLLQQFQQYGIYDPSRNRLLRGRKLRHSTPIPTPSSVRMTNSF